MRLIVSMILLSLGVVFWLWGTLWLPTRKSLLWKLHALGVADTLGSALIVTGLLVRSPDNWPALTLALISILFWGTMLCFVLARGVGEQRSS